MAKEAAGMNLFSYLSDPANWQGPDGIWNLLLQHLGYTVASVGIAAAIAIPLGIFIGHTGRGSFLVIGLSNAARAIPTLGLLVLVVLLLDTGFGPIIGVLAVLALPAILTATAAGIRGADHEAVHAANAIGMSPRQVVAKVEWPLALPLVTSGLRSATLQVVATATVAAYSSGEGLGRLLITGNATRNYPQMFAGAFMVAVLAIVLDILLGVLGWLAGRHASPGGRSSAGPGTSPKREITGQPTSAQLDLVG
jgi:osmoprotectant transport system permease protein